MKKIVLMLFLAVLAFSVCSCSYSVDKMILFEQKEQDEDFEINKSAEENVVIYQKTPLDIFCEEQDTEWERDKAQSEEFFRNCKTPSEMLCYEQDRE